MKLRQSFILGAAIAAGIFGLGSVGCGDDSAETSSSGSGGSGSSTGTDGAGGSVTLAKPPERPGEAPAGDGPEEGVTLGISSLYLGEGGSNWQNYGFDLDDLATGDANGDGKIDGSDLAAGGHCTPPGGEIAAPDMEDGPGGLDNSFGKNILPLIAPLLDSPSEQATDAIKDGSFTIALQMKTLGTGSEYDPIPTNLYAGVGEENEAGEFTGDWLYVNALLNNGDENDPKIKFDDAFVTGGTWVSGEAQPITLNLSIGGIDLALVIESAIITLPLGSGNTSGSGGTIAGVLDTEGFIAEIEKVAAVLGGGDICPGSAVLNGILSNIRNASDILKDGTNKSGVNCDGISIAIGFDMEPVTFVGIAPDPEPPGPSECE